LAFEDLGGTIEAIVFSGEPEKFRDLIAPDRIVFLTGEVDRKREEPALRVSNVMPLDEGRVKLADALILRVDGDALSPARLAELKSICESHRGDRHFHLRIHVPHKMSVLVSCDESLRVRPDEEFRSQVERVLGNGAFDLRGRRHAVPAAAI